ncbi:hypothetical protein RG903_05035 [Thermithiobacillus tepidarius DSM 3134]|uniref:hypothetical protein n=1 Tax=Thermithiobacillus tepidarius TaxID=929 RepID=UPI00048C99CB|nr:hypothetical protein [Thermithiobacillus tepidarius]
MGKLAFLVLVGILVGMQLFHQADEKTDPARIQQILAEPAEPGFWLKQQQDGSPLWVAALQTCQTAPELPGCSTVRLVKVADL